MHPALRKDQLFLQKTPIFHFFLQNTPHFISCLRACCCTPIMGLHTVEKTPHFPQRRCWGVRVTAAVVSRKITHCMSKNWLNIFSEIFSPLMWNFSQHFFSTNSTVFSTLLLIFVLLRKIVHTYLNTTVYIFSNSIVQIFSTLSVRLRPPISTLLFILFI